MRKKQLLKKRILALALSVSMVIASSDTYIVMAAESVNSQGAEEYNDLQSGETELETVFIPEDSDALNDAGAAEEMDLDGDSDAVVEESEADGTDSADDSGVTGETDASSDLGTAVEDNEEGVNGSEAEALKEERDSGATGLQVAYHTQDEIKAFLAESGAKKSKVVTYAEEPHVAAPYSAGRLSDETLASAVAMTNQIRYIAGLSYSVELDDSYSQLSQAASLVNYVNNKLSHNPEKPEDMDDALYQLGSTGASKSNIAWASRETIPLNETLVDSWMADDDYSNITILGHRRWVLNPSMGKIGFGAVKGSNGIYSAMHALDWSGGINSVFGVAWPAQNMPTDYFDSSYPWSVSLGETVDASEIQVKLTRASDGKEWNFSNASADGYFNVNNDNYGETGCIIFRPNLSDISTYDAGDVFEVEITKNGKSYVNYSVSFFDLSADDDGSGDPENVYISEITVADKVYDGEAYTYAETPAVIDESGSTVDVDLVHYYTGILADGSIYTQTAEAPTQAGSYKLTFTIAENDKYIAESVVYIFNIEKKEATITADSVKIETGEQLPELISLTYDVTGLLEGDKLTTQPQFKYSVEDISTAAEGSYEIIPYGADAGNNYSIQYVKGKLAVEAGGTGDDGDKQAVSISGITIADKIYDGAPIFYTGSAVVKDVEGYRIMSVTTNHSYTGTLANNSEYEQTAEAPTQAGNYTLTFTIAENDKYIAEPVVYNFTIEKKEVTIAAQSVEIETGEPLPELTGLTGLTCDVTGLLEGDELTTQPQLKYSADDISTDAEGSYYIIPYGADAGNNYSIVYVDGVLTIEASANNPSYEDKDDTSFPDEERIDLNSVSGTIAKIKAKTYDITTPYEPTVKVTVIENKKKKTLTEGTDYRVLYANNEKAGTATVTVKGNGIYIGDLTAEYTINPKSVKKLKIITGNVTGIISAGDIADTSKPLPVYVYDGAKLLTRGVDYNLSLKASTTKAITLSVEAVANTNYTGTTTAKLNIYDNADAAKLINPENIYLGDEETPHTETYETPFTGKAIKPAVTVKIGTATLTNKDYKVVYQNNKNAGTAYVIVTGKGEYKGKAVVPFSITSKQSDFTITNNIKDKTYNGKLQKPSVTVKAGSVKLKKGKDYTVTYSDNLHVGTATITVNGKGNYGKGNYIGTATKTFNINKQNIKKVSVKVNKNGGIDVYYGKILLRKDSDYTLEYGAQKGKNKIEVTVTAAKDSDFTGSMTKTVKVPAYIPVLKEANQTIEGEVGDTYQLHLEKPESQAAVASHIEFESSNSEMVTVDNDGLITMKKEGAALITASANKGKDVQQCYVIVKGDYTPPTEGPNNGRHYTYTQEAGTTDDTDAINAKLQTYEDGNNSKKYDYLYIPAGVYHIDPVSTPKKIGGIIMRDNQKLVMSPSALIIAKGNSSTNYAVIYAFGRENVTICGGQIIGDRDEHQGKGGEQGHGINIEGCKNVTINDVNISKCWGDGIHLGEYDAASGRVDCDGITIENCILHHNRRNNLSITDANNVTVDNCQFNYAKGTAPQCGIDIEPNHITAKHIIISNSTFKGNAKESIRIEKPANDIRIENCYLDGDLLNAKGKNVVLKNTTVKGKTTDLVNGIKRE